MNTLQLNAIRLNAVGARSRGEPLMAMAIADAEGKALHDSEDNQLLTKGKIEL